MIDVGFSLCGPEILTWATVSSTASMLVSGTATDTIINCGREGGTQQLSNSKIIIKMERDLRTVESQIHYTSKNNTTINLHLRRIETQQST